MSSKLAAGCQQDYQWSYNKKIDDSMPALEKIKLSRVKVFQNIATAPLGTLLQIEDGPPKAQVCLKAKIEAAGNQIDGVVHLEGARAGLFIGINELAGPALDLSDLAEIVLNNPAPKATGINQPAQGSVFEVSDRAGRTFFAMSVFLGQSPVVAGYVRLTDPDRGKIVNVNSVLYLGGAAVVEIKSQIV